MKKLPRKFSILTANIPVQLPLDYSQLARSLSWALAYIVLGGCGWADAAQK